MKINSLHTNSISFKGYNKVKDEKGQNVHHFYLPTDKSTYSQLILELAPVKKVGNYWVADDKNIFPVDMPKDSIDIDFGDYFNEKQPVGYRFRSGSTYFNDAGIKASVKDGTPFTVLFDKRTSVNKGGTMTLIVPDSYNVGYKFGLDGKPVKITPSDKEYALNNDERAEKSLRTHSNSIGGNFAGIAQKLPELKAAGVKRIVSTPFTKDDISSHKYWTETSYQIAKSFGTEHDFKLLQQQIFENGMNWVADGAFVNEGVQGPHFQHVLAYGENSPFYHWFKASGLKTGPLKLGIFPEKHDCVGFKFVNPEKFIRKVDGEVEITKNPNYDSSKPTYIQIFDRNLASAAQQNDSQNLIRNYENTNIDGKPFAINTHNDTVYPHYFDVKDFDNIFKRLEKLAGETSSSDIYGYDVARQLLKGYNFSVVDKNQASGLEFWDGNIDIPKLNFYLGNGDQRALESLPFSEREDFMQKINEGVSMVQDHTVGAGRYLTRNIALINIEHAAQLLKDVPKDASKEAYLEKLKGNNFPETAEREIKDIFDNIVNGSYKLKMTEGTESKRDFVTKNLMNFPLDTFECNPDLGAVLGSPFIANKVANADFIGSERYDLFKSGDEDDAIAQEFLPVYKKMNSVYQNEFTDLALKVLEAVNVQLPEKIFDGDRVTDFGKYAIQIYTPMIVKYALTKAFKPNAEISTYNDGDLNFEKAGIEDISKQSAGISAYKTSREAEQTVNLLRKGFKSVSSDAQSINFLADTIKNKLTGLNERSFKLAEVINDRTESGLCWRIDAAKDVACTDSIKDGIDDFEYNFDKITDFWAKFQNAVKKENEHAYIAAEITDFRDLIDIAIRGNAVKEFADENEKAECDRRIQEKKDEIRRELNRDITKDEADEVYYDMIKNRKNKELIYNFLTTTGINTLANYEFFFTDVQKMFAKKIDPEIWRFLGSDVGNSNSIKNSINNFIDHSPLDGLINSYTFVGNHDKPRILHVMALDVDLFQSNFVVPDLPKGSDYYQMKAQKEEEFRKDIKYTVDPEMTDVATSSSDGILIDKYNSKAIAMGMRLKQVFSSDEILKGQETAKIAICRAISDLSQGIYKGETFPAEAFGVKPIDKNIDAIIDVAKAKYGLNIDAQQEADLKQRVLLNTLKPAMDRYISMYKVLISLPGAPTDYAGDNLAMTGFETYNKNDFQQNRNALQWFRLERPGAANSEIRQFNTILKDIQSIRKDEKLSALNDGAITQAFAFGKNEAFGTFRYNDKGSMVVTLTNVSDIPKEFDTPVARKNLEFSEIYLGSAGDNQWDHSGILRLGLQEGVYFKNVRKSDNSVYGVVKKGDSYSLRCFASVDAYNSFIKSADRNGNYLNFSIEPDDFNTMILYRADNAQKENDKTENKDDNISRTLGRAQNPHTVTFGSNYNIKKEFQPKMLLNA